MCCFPKLPMLMDNDTFWINGVFMPDLTLDEFRGLSEEQLKRVLREEAVKAGFAEECSYDEEAAMPDTFCGLASASGP